MSAKIRCPQCGILNDVPQLICRQCGAKLDYDTLENRGCYAGAGGGARTVRFLVLAALVAALGLMLWPVTPAGRVGSATDAEAFHAKFILMETAIRFQQPYEMLLDEGEINAYLAEMVLRSGGAARGRGLQLGLKKINLASADGRLTLLVAASWGPATLTYEVGGAPAREADGAGSQWQIRSARIGHLPLPRLADGWIMGKLGVIFANLQREAALLRALSVLEPRDGKIRVAVGQP